MRGFVITVAAIVVGLWVYAQCGDNVKVEATPEDKVVICHFDRNNTGPNAGSHTIEVAASAADGHLTLHTAANGYLGSDFLGGCPTPTNTPTVQATFTPVPTDTSIPTQTSTATASPTATVATSTSTAVPTETETPSATATPTDTVTPEDTATNTPIATETPEDSTRRRAPTETPTASATATVSVPVVPTGDTDTPVTSLPSAGDGGTPESGLVNGIGFVLAWAMVFFLIGCAVWCVDKFLSGDK